MKRIMIFSLLLAACLAAPAAAQMPPVLSYQGILADASGTAVPDNTYSITFRIYDVGGTGGSPLWTETNNVVVSKGTFSALLGATAMLSILPFDETYYIGLSVEGGAELPRQILARTPYSFSAKAVSGTENVFPSSGKVGIGTLAPDVPLTVTSASGQVGIRFDGNDDSYASIYVNAVKPGVDAGFGYETQGILRAYTFVDPSNNWNLQLAGSNYALRASEAGNVCVGAGIPSSEKLRVDGGIQLGNSAGSTTGTIRWTGSDFEGYNGSVWQSFTANDGGPPAGSSGQTLRHDGSDWIASSNLYNNGTNIGIGTMSPSNPLHVATDDICGIRIDGTSAGAWSLMRLNAAGSGSNPGIELMRQGVSKALMYVAAGDDWRLDMAASNGLTVDGVTGNLGVGVLTPAERLDVAGALRLGAASGSNAGTIRWTGSDFEGYDGATWQSFTSTGEALPSGISGQTLRHNGSTWTASSNLYNNGTNIGIGTAAPNARLHVVGDAALGTSGTAGALYIYNSSLPSPVISLNPNTYGGSLTLRDEESNYACSLEPDHDGSGGWLGVTRSSDMYAFLVDGNSSGTGQPTVYVLGDDREAIFDMNESGDRSIWLPYESVSSSEILDEPGVASYTNQNGSALEASISTVASQSITIPAGGFVLVIASSNVQIYHTNGVASHGIIGTSNSAGAFPGNQDYFVDYPAGAATGYYFIPATCHGLYYQPSAGTYTYYLLGQEGSGAYACYENQLSLIYLPTMYGSVYPTLADAAGTDEKAMGAALTAADVAAQKAASEADNARRMRSELDELRAEVDAMKTKLGTPAQVERQD